MPLPFIIGGIIAAGHAVAAVGAVAAAGAVATVASLSAAQIIVGIIGLSVVGGVITCAYLNRELLKKIAKSFKEKTGADSVSLTVKHCLKTGNCNKVNIGLRDSNGNRNDMDMETKEVASDVYEGERITA